MFRNTALGTGGLIRMYLESTGSHRGSLSQKIGWTGSGQIVVKHMD